MNNTIDNEPNIQQTTHFLIKDHVTGNYSVNSENKVKLICQYKGKRFESPVLNPPVKDVEIESFRKVILQSF